MKMWSDLILAYTKAQGAYAISLFELYSSPLANNTSINRRLSMDALHSICAWMQ